MWNGQFFIALTIAVLACSQVVGRGNEYLIMTISMDKILLFRKTSQMFVISSLSKTVCDNNFYPFPSLTPNFK